MHLRRPPTSSLTDDPARQSPLIADTAVVLAYARMLEREGSSGSVHPWLRGKNIGSLAGAGNGTDEALFRQAATELGAQVTPIRPFSEGGLEAAEIQETARLIGRLYDAVDWPGASSELLQRIRSTAGIPIYDGLAAARHPTARLAGLLGPDAAWVDRRRFVLQAVLLATMI
jgi:ornithine carbamoyltransferase